MCNSSCRSWIIVRYNSTREWTLTSRVYNEPFMTLIPRFSEPLQTSHVQCWNTRFCCRMQSYIRRHKVLSGHFPETSCLLPLMFPSVHPDFLRGGRSHPSWQSYLLSSGWARKTPLGSAVHRRLCREQYPTVSWPKKTSYKRVLIPDSNLFGGRYFTLNVTKFAESQLSRSNWFKLRVRG